MRFGTRVGVAAFAVAMIAVGSVAAQPTGSTSRADDLFNQGRTLLEAGKFKLACIKFQQSLDEADALGTRLNLALCMERRGKVHTALVKFEETAELARKQGEPQSEQVAREHAEALRPLVPTITVKVAKQLPGMRLVVTRPDEVDRAVPASLVVELDPSDPNDPADKVTIRASAPGHADFSSEAIVVPQKAKETVEIPELSKLGGGGGTTEPIEPGPPKSRRKLYAIGLGVVGAGLIAGSAVWANKIQSGAQRDCLNMMPQPETCEYAGANKTKIRYMTNGMFVAGIAAIGVGAYLFLTAPSSGESRDGTAVMPTVTPDGPGIVVLGHF